MVSYTKRRLHISRGIKTWYLRTYVDGKTTYTSLKTTSAKVAQEIVDRLNAARFFPGAKMYGVDDEKKIEIPKACREFLDKSAAINPASVEPYNTAVSWFLGYCKSVGAEFLQEFTRSKASVMLEHMSSIFEPRTVRLRVAVVRLVFKTACERYELDLKDPFIGLKLPKIVKLEKDFWTVEQIMLILSKSPCPEMRIAWAFMGFAGLRVHEALKVKKTDIDADGLHVLGKGAKRAVLPISEKLANELKLFEESGGRWDCLKVDDYTSNKRLKNACHAAGVPLGSWCTNHKLRHSFASNLARVGCPPKVAQQLCRHANIQTTLEIYTHVVPEDVKKWSEMV